MNLTSRTFLTVREREKYSIARALANANVRRIGATSCLETETSDAIRSESNALGIAPQGIMIPFECLTRTLGATTAGAGGYTVADQRGPVDPFPFPQSQIRQAGARSITGLMASGTSNMGNVGLPVLKSSDEGAWLPENTPADETKDSAFALASATPHRIVATRKVSKQLREQMQNDEAFLMETLTAPVAAALDRGALTGSGGVQPVGILYTPDVGTASLGTDGGAPTLASLNTSENNVITANFDVRAGAYFTSPNARAKLKGTQKAAGASTFLLETVNGQDFCNGYRSFPTSFLPDTLTKGNGANLGSLIFGDFSKLFIVTWAALDVVINPYTYAASGLELWVTTVYADIVSLRPQAFSVVNDMVTT